MRINRAKALFWRLGRQFDREPIELQDQNQRMEDERSLALIEARRNSPTVSFEVVMRETLDRD